MLRSTIWEITIRIRLFPKLNLCTGICHSDTGEEMQASAEVGVESVGHTTDRLKYIYISRLSLTKS